MSSLIAYPALRRFVIASFHASLALLLAACGSTSQSDASSGDGGSGAASSSGGTGGADVVGTGSGGNGSGTGGAHGATIKAATPEEYLDSLLTIMCSKFACIPDAKLGAYENCYSYYSTQFASSGAQAETTFLPESAKACLVAMDALACGESTEVLQILSECQTSVAPSATEGKACVAGTCASFDLYCDNASSECGICKKRGALDASCTEDKTCDAGLVCVDSFCKTAKKTGEACATTDECLIGLTCDDFGDGPHCQSASSRRVKKLGEDCAWPSMCEVGAYCSGVTKKCVGPAKAGGACDFTMPDSCPPDQGCSAPVNGSGTCKPLVKAGGACTGPNACEPSTTCLNKVCFAPKGLGENCSGNLDCASNNCSASGTCEKRPNACQ